MRNPFSASSDDVGVRMSRRAARPDDRTAEALLTGRSPASEPALSAFVGDVLAAIPTEAPPPSAELAAMLESGLVGAPAVLPAALSRRRARTWRNVGIGTAAALGLVISAGAANALPAPAQNAVADVVNAFSPVDLPHAHDRGASQEPDQHRVTPGASESPEPVVDQRSGGGPDQSGDRHIGTEIHHDGTDSRDTSTDGSSDSTSSSTKSGDDGSVSTRTDSSSGSGSGSGSDTSSGGDHTSPSPTPTSSPHDDSGSGGSTSGSGSGSNDGATPTPTPTHEG